MSTTANQARLNIMVAQKLACENATDVSCMIALLFETMAPRLVYFLSPQQHCCKDVFKALGQERGRVMGVHTGAFSFTQTLAARPQ